MHVWCALTMAVLSAAASIAQIAPLTHVSKAQAERLAVGYGSPEQRIAMWIWADKYTYNPGQPVTIKWTVKTNGDLYPYTVVAYRQNNQTGAKTFLPGGDSNATDILGNTVAQGLAPAQLADVTKETLIGGGGRLPAVNAPNEPGMHTIVVQLRDYTGTRVLKAAYMKIGVVTETVQVSGAITSDTTWVNTKAYRLSGVVTVRGATLSIEPGTIITGAPGSQPASTLLITRTSKLNANGTKSRPVIFTSDQPFGQRKRGDWGGVLMLGQAPINVGANSGGNVNAAGTFFIEGLNTSPDAVYGGADPNHNCGSLTYTRIEYSGVQLTPNNETNSFTWAACGKQTVAHHLQAIYGADDSFEFFGGNMDAKYLVGGLGADDYVDYQLGYTGRIQFGLFYQSPDSRGNRGLEGDNSEYDNAATPFSNPTMYNLTFIGSRNPGFDEAASPGIFLRRGARGTLANIVVQDFNSAGIELTDANTQAQGTAGNIVLDGILVWNNNVATAGAGNTLDGQVTNVPTRTFLGGNSVRNLLFANPQLRRVNEYSDPNFAALFGSPIFRAGFVAPPDDGFFDQSATFIGGIGDEDWTEEWTSFLVETDII